MMTERGVAVDHSTIYRWVQRFAPEMEKRLRWQWRRPRSRSWRIDETYVRVRGQWAYLYRALDKFGNTLDFYLSSTAVVLQTARPWVFETYASIELQPVDNRLTSSPYLRARVRPLLQEATGRPYTSPPRDLEIRSPPAFVFRLVPYFRIDWIVRRSRPCR